MERIKAPIDNKNIVEWFTENFHDGDCIESLNNGITCQVFYLEGCLCEIKYLFGQNWFKFRIIEGSADDVRKCNKEFESIIRGMNDGGNDEVIYNPTLGTYEFYFVVES